MMETEPSSQKGAGWRNLSQRYSEMMNQFYLNQKIFSLLAYYASFDLKYYIRELIEQIRVALRNSNAEFKNGSALSSIVGYDMHS